MVIMPDKNSIECPLCKQVGVLILRNGLRVCPKCGGKWINKKNARV